MTTPFSADPTPADLIGTAQALKIAAVSKESLYRWIRRGRLRAWRVVGRLRVSRADVVALAVPVEARSGPPAAPRPSPKRREREKAAALAEMRRRLGI